MRQQCMCDRITTKTDARSPFLCIRTYKRFSSCPYRRELLRDISTCHNVLDSADDDISKDLTLKINTTEGFSLSRSKRN